MLASLSGLALFGLALCTLCELGLGGQISAGSARALELSLDSSLDELHPCG